MTRIITLIALSLTLAATPAAWAADEHHHGDHAPAATAPTGHEGHGAHQMASPEEMQKRMLRWMPKAESKVGARLDPKLSFIDGAGKKRTLGEFFDKPLFVTFVFATCPHICPTIAANLAARVEKAGKEGKGGFRTLVISFDTATDSAAGMKGYAAGFRDNPDFIGGVAEASSVGALTEAFGFSYMPHPTEVWAHITMITAVDTGGVVVRQIFGTKVPSDEFAETVDGLLTPGGK
ncbi:MAG: SCO family protein [Nitrospinae bacterium]|nr:SCO family protein [Nitrospinota bacterium]